MANTILDQYATDFSDLEPRQQLSMLIEIGDELPAMDADKKNEQTEIHGCQSAAYLVARIQDNTVVYTGWADARTVRGYMAILCEALSNQSIEYICDHAQQDLQAFLDKTKLADHLTPNRANSIGNIFSAMYDRAKALKGYNR